MVQTQNPEMKTGEGLTRIKGLDCTFLDAIDTMESEILGSYSIGEINLKLNIPDL